MKKQYAIDLLMEKSKQLGRNPKRDDFDSQTQCLIKQKLGPWPRALEQAGLKDVTKISSAEKNRKKRKRVKLNCKAKTTDN